MLKGASEADALVNASRDLLKQGDAVGAERVLAPVFSAFKSDAPVLHLMGQIKKAQNQLEEAERHFRAAVANSLSEGGYYNDLGLVLQARGQFAEAVRVFRAALALTPHLLMVRVNIVRCLMAIGDLAEAEREARAYIAAHPGPESWTLLGTVQRAQERHQDALVSAETALKYGPKLRGLRYNLATALDKVGRSGEALDIYEKLARQELDTPDLALNFARALYAAGREKDAEAIAERGVEQWPTIPLLQTTLARMRWLRGEGENGVALLEAAIAQHPNDLHLRLACADALHRGGHNQKALGVLEAACALAPDAPALLTALGVVLDELDRPRDGLKALKRAAEVSPTRASQRNLLSTLLRAGQPSDALALARQLRQDEPEEQYLVACEATALRLLGDESYRTLYDYERFVRSYDVPAPRGYFTAENFNASLADVLRAQHRSNAHPLDQHLPNGSQTGRSLLGLGEGVIKHFLAAVDASIQDYITRLDPSDPMGRRRTPRYRFSNLWSVRLTGHGYQPNHVHDRGWISGVYWVAVLGAERPANAQAGWLKLGEPNRPPAQCGPERLIEPKPGSLLLFPSYIWRGTIPFEGAEVLSLGFDIIPG